MSGCGTAGFPTTNAAGGTICWCCLTSEQDIAIDDISGLCLACQPCPYCGRTGTGCDDQRGPRGCDPLPQEPPARTTAG